MPRRLGDKYGEIPTSCQIKGCTGFWFSDFRCGQILNIRPDISLFYFPVTKGFEEKSVILLLKKLFIFIKLNIFIKASVLNNSSLLTMARYPAFLLTGYSARYLAAHRAWYHIKMPNYLDCLPLKLLLLQKGLNELQCNTDTNSWLGRVIQILLIYFFVKRNNLVQLYSGK